MEKHSQINQFRAIIQMLREILEEFGNIDNLDAIQFFKLESRLAYLLKMLEEIPNYKYWN